MKFITFTGLDGSGKSTQLALLKTRLKQEGKKVATFHAIEFSVANKISLALSGGGTFIPGKEKAITHASFFSLFLRKIFLLIDIFRFRYFKKNLERDGVDFLLSDRYFYDTVLNILYLSFPKVKERGSNNSPPVEGSGVVESLIPRPDIALYLRITPEEILKRAHVPEQGIEYLQKKFDILEQKKSDWHLIEIDASQEKDSIFFYLLRFVLEIG